LRPRHVDRKADQRILDPATHPRRWVSLVVAAAYLEVDRRTLRKYLAEGLIAYEQRLSRRRVAVTELVAFAQRSHHPRRHSFTGNSK
jgi:hypothetical protein